MIKNAEIYCVRGIRDVTNGDDSILQQFCICIVPGGALLIIGKVVAVARNSFEEWDEPGMFGNQPFHVRQLQVAVDIYKPWRQYAFVCNCSTVWPVENGQYPAIFRQFQGAAFW